MFPDHYFIDIKYREALEDFLGYGWTEEFPQSAVKLLVFHADLRLVPDYPS